MLVLIGNSPSSGSTFLGDLLDSTPISVCGPELNLFSNKNLYSPERFQKQPFAMSGLHMPGFARVSPYYGFMDAYDLDKAKLKTIHNKSKDLEDFADRFKERYLALRGMPEKKIWFEKTPQNANCLGEFLDAFPQSRFIYVVRNPLYVARSLKNRGYSDFVAANTWLCDIAKFAKFRHDPRVTLVKYEDLIARPYETVSDLLEEISGEKTAPEQLRLLHENNQYRRDNVKRIESWSTNASDNIFNANDVAVGEKETAIFSMAWNSKITTEYATVFDLAEISFRDAIALLGYEADLADIGNKNSDIARLNYVDVFNGVKKLVVERIYGSKVQAPANTFFQPVEHI